MSGMSGPTRTRTGPPRTQVRPTLDPGGTHPVPVWSGLPTDSRAGPDPRVASGHPPAAAATTSPPGRVHGAPTGTGRPGFLRVAALALPLVLVNAVAVSGQYGWGHEHLTDSRALAAGFAATLESIAVY